jgi:hypothetical protein
MATRRNEGCQHVAPTRLRMCTRAALRRGLDGALWAALARPVGQATRGFVVKLLAWHTGWRINGWQQSSGPH